MDEEEEKNEDMNGEDSGVEDDEGEDDEGEFFDEENINKPVGISEDRIGENVSDVASGVEDIVRESDLDNVDSRVERGGVGMVGGDEKIEDKGVIEKKQNKQVMWAIVLMVSLIVIIFAVPYITKNYINKFDAYGLEFKKTRLGDLIFYSTKFPTIDTVTGQVIGDYSINLRSDPRDLDYIEVVDIPNNTITFMKDVRGFYAPVYLSLDSNLEMCEDNGIALMNLAGFLRDSDLEVKSAVTNATYAEENGIEFATCLEKPSNTVIRFHNANKTAIYKTSKNCYDLVFKDCEIIAVAEKFELIMLQEYMGHFKEME